MSESPAMPQPRCPHCKEPIVAMGLYFWIIQPWFVIAAFCPNDGCKMILQTQVVPADITAAPPGRPPS